MSNTRAAVLYRHFNAEGRLLYVGISASATKRTEQHRRSSSWAQEIRRIEIETFPSRQAAMDAERTAIVMELPMHNSRPTNISAVHRIIELLGSEAIERELGLSEFSIRAAKRDRRFPATWYKPLSELCANAGIECPMSAFNWKIVNGDAAV